MQNIFSKISSIKNYVLYLAFGVFILYAIIGGILVLANPDILSDTGKILTPLAILAVSVVVLIDNFRKLNSDSKGAQTLALISLILGPLCVLFLTLMIWEVIPYYEEMDSYGYFYSYYSSTPTVFAKLITSAVYLEALAFFGSNILAIKENSQKIVSIIKPVAVTVLSCAVLFGILNIFVDFGNDYLASAKMNILSMITWISFIGTSIAAFFISKAAVWDKKEVTSIEKTAQTVHIVSEPLYPEKKTDYDPELAAKYGGDSDINIQEEATGDHDNAI